MKNWEMITVKNYLDEIEVKCTSASEKEITEKVERYMLNQKRYETNEKIVEALLG
ncbi:hypothetical protein IJ579_08360 [bacterium]|nr:hypothetical protein [bacterium]